MSSYPILEDKAYKDPRRVVDARSRRRELDRVEYNRYRDIDVPVVRPLSLPVPQGNGEENTDDSRKDFWVVY